MVKVNVYGGNFKSPAPTTATTYELSCSNIWRTGDDYQEGIKKYTKSDPGRTTRTDRRMP